MKPNRRKFLQQLAIGTGAAAIGLPAFAGEHIPTDEGLSVALSTGRGSAQFNMSGYAAPKIDKVKIGIVGLGSRGSGAVSRMSFIEGAEVKALCDKVSEKVTAAQKTLTAKGLPKAKEFSGENGWKQMIDNEDLDLIYICTPWSLHTPMAVYAMEHGKHAATEVPAALTLEDCWKLVETSEKTRKHCMMLENCCYDFFELLVLNMSRQGLLGDIVHGEGAYIHDLLKDNFSKDKYYNMWRLKENLRNGNLYPTHGLGPVAQVMNINRGDKMESLVSRQSDDFSMAALAKELAAKDDFYKPYANKRFRGNLNTTAIRTAKGRTIMLQHDVSSPNVYSRIYKISGTKGSALKYPLPGRFSLGHQDWVSAEEHK